MSQRAYSPLATLAGVCLLAAVPPTVPAIEICLASGCDFATQSMSTTEEPDPLGLWMLIQDLSFPHAINPNGPSGPPSVALQPAGYGPAVVWATAERTDHDIAFCEWTEAGWRPRVLIAAGLEDDRDPRIVSTSDGTLHVVWWQPVRDRVLWITRLAGRSTWTAPRTVAFSARRPSLALAASGETLIAYERPGPLGQQVIVRSERGTQAPVEVVVATTPRTKPLDARVHVVSGSVWADWEHADGRLGYARRLNGAWQPAAALVPWTDTGDWTSEERIRRDVRTLVLAAPVY